MARLWTSFRGVPLWVQILAWIFAWPLLAALLLVSDPAGPSTGRKVGGAAVLVVALPLWVGAAFGDRGGDDPTVQIDRAAGDEDDGTDEDEEPGEPEELDDEPDDDDDAEDEPDEDDESVPEPEPAEVAPWTVTNVVDGDTVDVRGPAGAEERVRIVGIDTPEQGECGFDRAARAMAALVHGEQVELVAGAQDDRDHYDRILRYVDGDGTDAGLSLIEQGLAISRYDSRDGYGRHDREDAYVAADESTEHVCTQPEPEPEPEPKPEPEPEPDSSSNPWGTDSCHPAYDPCVPPASETGDLNCPDIREHHPHGVEVDHTHGDPHGLDRDKDSRGCE